MPSVKSVFLSTAILATPLMAQNPSLLRPLAIIEAGRNPHQISFSNDGAKAYVAAAGSDWIAVIDVPSLKLEKKHPVQGTPLGVAVLPGDEGFLVSLFQREGIVRLSPTFQVLDQLPTGRGSSLLIGPGLAPEDGADRRFLVSTEQVDKLWVLGGSPTRLQTGFAVGDRPFPPAFSRDGRWAFVPSYDDGAVTVVDLKRSQVAGRVEVGRTPSGGAVLPGDREYAVVVRGEDHVAWIDIETRRVTGRLRQGIGRSPFSLVLTPDNRYGFVNNTADHDISIIDLKTKQVIERVAVGEIPIVMAVHPSGATLWVSSEGSHQVTVFGILPGPAPGDSHGQGKADQAEEVAMEERCRREVLELHQFFEDWSLGRVSGDDSTFHRLADVLAEDFQIVGPRGHLNGRSGLLNGLRKAYAGRRGKTLRIWIENLQGRPLSPDLYLVTYEEWQSDGAGKRGRLSSAVLRRSSPSARTPNGVEWLHVAETWLPQG